ncbi:hypothetical protein E2C01_036509 [Portunus trituberculatus]|uniref:Uncharacterized protein n=1 Tax=Portunus trituberculatus TaxID=210409 RepID=A0A5B7FCN5_PORTR|nr:hypothetical protein [Portunus trituberculatus]
MAESPHPDVLLKLQVIEDNRRQEAAERRQEEEQRRREKEERRRQEDERRESQRREEFKQLLETVAQQSRFTPQLAATSPTSPSPTLSPQPLPAGMLHPTNTKAVIHPSPPLQSDVTFPDYKAWKRQKNDYATFTDLAKLDLPKQHIQLRMCMTPEVLHILQYRLRVTPDDMRSIEQVLDALEQHVKAQTNEALRHRDLFSCKQRVGECFNDFFVRVKNLAEAVDICKGANTQCEETQLKQVLLMGVCDQDLVRELISTIATKTLDETV